jgi:hypothetical protein
MPLAKTPAPLKLRTNSAEFRLLQYRTNPTPIFDLITQSISIGPSLQAEQNRPYSVPAGPNCLPNTHRHSGILLLSDLLILTIPLRLDCRIGRCRLLCSLRLLLHSIARILFGHDTRGLIVRISISQRRVFVLICWHSIHLLSWLCAQMKLNSFTPRAVVVSAFCRASPELHLLPLIEISGHSYPRKPSNRHLL